MEEIEITIGPDGETSIDLNGFHGQGCAEITDQLIKALGGTPTIREHKAEYYQVEQKTKVKQQTRM